MTSNAATKESKWKNKFASLKDGFKTLLANKSGKVSKKVMDGSRCSRYVNKSLREIQKNRKRKARKRKKENTVCVFLILSKSEIAKKMNTKTYKNLKSCDANPEKPNI